jgi:hypothetical protein
MAAAPSAAWLAKTNSQVLTDSGIIRLVRSLRLLLVMLATVLTGSPRHALAREVASGHDHVPRSSFPAAACAAYTSPELRP